MTVKFVTHPLKTGDIGVMGHINDMVTVRGHKISRIGAIEGQEQENPAAIHVNFEVIQGRGSVEMLVLMLGLSDAVELGLQLIAMGIEDQASPNVEEIGDRLTQLIRELDQTLQVSH